MTLEEELQAVSGKTFSLTGGSGFIGRFVAARLTKSGARVHVIDQKCPDFLVDAFSQVDLKEERDLSKCLQLAQPHYVIHLAANADIRSDRNELMKNNVEGTRTLIHVLPDSVEAISFASTQLVVRMGIDPKDGNILDPYTEYGESKAEMEKAIRSECSIPWTILRPTTIWGPHHPSFANSIWKFIEKGYYLHPSLRAPIIRSFGFVENAAAQIVRLTLAAKSSAHRRVFYVTDAPIDSGLYFDKLSLALRGKPVRRVPAPILKSMCTVGEIAKKVGLPAPLDLGRYERMTSDYQVPFNDTFEICGSPSVDLIEGIRKTRDWYFASVRKDDHKGSIS